MWPLAKAWRFKHQSDLSKKDPKPAYMGLQLKAPGATLPRLQSEKKLLKSKAEENSHANFAKGPPTGAILFHNFFKTDLSVVTVFHKMLRTFTTEAPFFSVAHKSPAWARDRPGPSSRAPAPA
jgi:hypothetical protein